MVYDPDVEPDEYYMAFRFCEAQPDAACYWDTRLLSGQGAEVTLIGKGVRVSVILRAVPKNVEAIALAMGKAVDMINEAAYP